MSSATTTTRENIVEFMAFLLIQYCGSLRGEEVPMCDASGFYTHFEEGMNHPTYPHVMVYLLGRFKNEIGERNHLIPIAARAASGLQPGVWVGRLLELRLKQKVVNGPLFIGPNNKDPIKMSVLVPMFYDLLLEIQEEYPRAISPKVEVPSAYGMSRSARRGATTQARVKGVSEPDIDVQNRL